MSTIQQKSFIFTAKKTPTIAPVVQINYKPQLLLRKVNVQFCLISRFAHPSYEKSMFSYDQATRKTLEKSTWLAETRNRSKSLYFNKGFIKEKLTVRFRIFLFQIPPVFPLPPYFKKTAEFLHICSNSETYCRACRSKSTLTSILPRKVDI